MFLQCFLHSILPCWLYVDCMLTVCWLSLDFVLLSADWWHVMGYLLGAEKIELLPVSISVPCLAGGLSSLLACPTSVLLVAFRGGVLMRVSCLCPHAMLQVTCACEVLRLICPKCRPLFQQGPIVSKGVWGHESHCRRVVPVRSEFWGVLPKPFHQGSQIKSRCVSNTRTPRHQLTLQTLRIRRKSMCRHLFE